MKKNIIKTIVLCWLILPVGGNVFAQFPGNQNDTGNLEGTTEETTTPGTQNDTGNLEGDDVPPAPIGDYVIPMALVGILMSYRFLKHRHSNRI